MGGLRFIHRLLPPSLRVLLSPALRQALLCGRRHSSGRNTQESLPSGRLAASWRQTGRGQGPEGKKLRKGRESRREGNLSKVVREGLLEEVTFQRGLARSEGASQRGS